MKDRIDPLIAERAPWLFASRPETRLARAALDRVLGYDWTIALGETLQALPADTIMQRLGQMLARDVEVRGLENLPRQGAALIVANHPTGIADGIMLHHAISPLRPDAFYFANHDILRVLPQFEAMIAPVEWRKEKRSHAKTRETMAYTRNAVEAGRLGVIFPSGRLAKRRGLSLHERPWMASAAMIARKFDLPVIPVNIRARNSVLFYLFDLVHPTLRDITLFHETLNKDRQPYRITIGEPISASALPAKSEDGIEMLRRATLALGGARAPAVSLVDATRRPGWLRA
ncbi:lysophospholipid acyltransferase family protein [Thetidibacter halocola]|uniref:Lysophospholipid acyltransferase family protein n=1 Tax=Thetidibacter halocola TaxID=2827239 RepID=A0A8J7WAE8_9RHOB|nr:lysophospholipid acyltransferase family protein [Thetidibacter halocola]MBS0123162.1 lysophospholipid acyltransferase family protein [Thetidibacter halocola]